SAGTAVAWREEASNELLQAPELVGIAADEGRIAVALGDEVVVSPCPERLEGTFVAHDAKAIGVEAADDTMILAYLIEPARSEYLLDDLSAEYAVEAVAEPEAEEETARLVRHAAVTLRLRDPLLDRVRERGVEPLYRDVEMPLTSVLGRMQEAGVRIDTYRMGEITARLADRVEELESRAYELAGEEFVLGSPQQLGRILFEEWRELSKLLNTYLRPLPSLLGPDGRLHTTFNQAVAATGRLSTTNPNLQSIPIRTELGREIRSAFIAEPG